jgi:hypothetical protein
MRLVDGVLAIIVALRGETPHRITMALRRSRRCARGRDRSAYPGLAALVLLYIMAAWAILTGVLQIMGAVRLRHVVSSEWGMILGGGKLPRMWAHPQGPQGADGAVREQLIRRAGPPEGPIRSLANVATTRDARAAEVDLELSTWAVIGDKASSDVRRRAR